MEDVISRADAIRLVKQELDFLGSRDINAAVLVLEKMPSANCKAEWEQLDDGYRCTGCGRKIESGDNPHRYGLHFCPQCGSEMQ